MKRMPMFLLLIMTLMISCRPIPVAPCQTGKIALTFGSPDESGILIYSLDKNDYQIFPSINPGQIIWHPSGNFVTYTEYLYDQFPGISIANLTLADNTETTPFFVSPNNSRPMWSPNGEKLAFSQFLGEGERKNVFIYQVEDDSVIEITENEELQEAPLAWYGEDRLLMWSYSEENRANEDFPLYIVDLTNMKRELFYVSENEIDSAFFNSDNSKLIFTTFQHHQVALLDVKSKEIDIIEAVPQGSYATNFSPDDQCLAYVYNNDFYIYNIQDGTTAQIPDLPSKRYIYFDWMP